MATTQIRQDAFPAAYRQANGTVNNIPTEVTSTSFSDKVIITVSQAGRLAQWIQVPLQPPTPTYTDTPFLPLSGSREGLSALPSLHLTPTTLLGGGGDERETLGQLYATQIASHLSRRNPDDQRMMVLGLGLGRELEVESREGMFDVLELVLKVL